MSTDLTGLKGFYMYILNLCLTLHNNKKSKQNRLKYPEDPYLSPDCRHYPELNSLLVATAV